MTETYVLDILEKVFDDKELSFDEVLDLFESEGEETSLVLEAADKLRSRVCGDIITYVKVRNINFTNICLTGCLFCAFGRRPSDEDAYRLTLDEIAKISEEAYKRGATEVCLQGGIDPFLDGKFYLDILKTIKNIVPDIHIHAFSPFEILTAAKKMGVTINEFLLMLKDNGLGSIPGTAAEIFNPEIRNRLCKNKLRGEEWIDVIKKAHSLDIPTTATMMYGHIEKPCHWVEHLMIIRDIQKETGGFTEFIPLGFIHPNTKLYLNGGARPGATQEEHLKIHAISRLVLHPYIKNIQVSWVKLGKDIAQYILKNAGANDFGGTLMNENITRSAGGTNGEYISETEIRERIESINRIPARRDTLYNILKIYKPVVVI